MEVTTPLITLVDVVKQVNTGLFEVELPPLNGGSREVKHVYNSFTKLFKILRASNIAFFSRSLTLGYHLVQNAFNLFQKISDKKALAITSNDLGNTLFALRCEAKFTHGCQLVEGTCCIIAGLSHLNSAIENGNEELKRATNSIIKAEYAQQLANRHFNRSMLYLSASNDPCCPSDARGLCFQDLLCARKLDNDVRDFWMTNKLAFQNSDVYFDRLIRRLHGLIFLEKTDSHIASVWNIEEAVVEACNLLHAAWSDPSAPMFHEINRVGRCQQLEGVLVRVALHKGHFDEAFSAAMRMLVEDEYLIESSFVAAADAFLHYMNNGTGKESATWCCHQLHQMVKQCKSWNVNVHKNIVFAIELSDKWASQPILSEINSCVLSLYEQCCLTDNVGVVASSSHSDKVQTVGIAPNHGRQQQDVLDSATQTTSGTMIGGSFFVAVQMAWNPQQIMNLMDLLSSFLTAVSGTLVC